MQTLSDRAQALKELRQMIDFIARHPEIPVPTYVSFVTAVSTRDELATVAKISGWKKDYSDNWFTLIKEFGQHRLHVYIDRAEVCRKVKTGTKKIIPAQPEHEVEEFEWVCEDVGLLGEK